MASRSILLTSFIALFVGVGCFLVVPRDVVTAAEPESCNCAVQGKINLDESCTSTTLELWCWNYISQAWERKDSGTYHDGDTFLLHANGFVCLNNGRLKSNGNWITDIFLMPGCSGTTQLGNVYDPNSCESPGK